jgi:hypothetical protein
MVLAFAAWATQRLAWCAEWAAPWCLRLSRRQQEDVEDKNQKNKKITYYLESDAPNGNVLIDEFVAKALDLYKQQESGKVDRARYLYIPVLSGWGKAPGEDNNNDENAALKVWPSGMGLACCDMHVCAWVYAQA